MRKWFVVVALLLVASFSGPHSSTQELVPVTQIDVQTDGEQVADESTGAWFVELSGVPTADGATVASLEAEEAAFHAAASTAGIAYQEERHYRRLWNGLTVRSSNAEAQRLRYVAGVRAVYPVLQVRLHQSPDTPVNVPEMFTAIAQTRVDIAQNTLGLTGAGVRVAVMDTGIDYDHPDLGGCFGPGCRVEKGWDFVGDAYNSSSPTSVRAPDAFPDDCEGHGTHVAGIVGANGTLKGVAPGVTFHAYRVFGCTGTTSADVMLEAMERAVADGSDVLNMSIGAAYQWPEYPTSQAADRAVKQGMVVVAAIGNNGPNGLYAASAPGNGAKVIGVASFDNTHSNVAAFSISPDNRLVGYNPASGVPFAPTSGTAPIARTGTPASTADACNATAPAPGSLAGHVALIRRGTCGFYEKAFNAQAAGAVGVVLYNNVAGLGGISAAGTPAVTIPVVFIQAADGVEINNRMDSGPVTMTWTSNIVSLVNATAGLISSFSSFGPSPALTLKPDIGAPGGAIRSTIPLELGGYGPNNGTSMASPHVAGAVALLLQARPNLTPTQVSAILHNGADPHLWFGNPGLGFLDNVHRQGAGMLDMVDAVYTEAYTEPSKLALGEIESGAVTREIKVGRIQSPFTDLLWKSKTGVTYTLSHEPALSTGPNTFTPGFLASFASLSFSAPTITVGGSSSGRSAFSVTITPPANANARVFGGYIVLTPNNGTSSLRIPYTGYNGDYQAIPTLVPTVNNFPWLAKQSGTSFVNQPTGASYTLQGTDLPVILFHLDHAVARLTAEVFEVGTGKSRGVFVDEKFVPRNSGAATFFTATWDGTKGGGVPAPNGTYQVRLTVLKALGNRAIPAHTQTWTSPNIVIARPTTMP